MKNLIIGLLLVPVMVPALLGTLMFYHVFIDSKRDGHNGDITNRTVRMELMWLAMSKPHLFVSVMPDLVVDVEKRNWFKERQAVQSKAYDYDYFVASNPDLAEKMLKDEKLVAMYWTDHMNECRPSSPDFDVNIYRSKYAYKIAPDYNQTCETATYHWAIYGGVENRKGR